MDKMSSAWTEEDKRKWCFNENAKPLVRSYHDDVLMFLDSLKAKNGDHIHVIEYGLLRYDNYTYPMKLLQIGAWDHDKPCVFVQGGTHGYEPSGVAAALKFAEDAKKYVNHFNILIAPCTSPWSYETDNRWNPQARDPNRAFVDNTDVPEARLLMDFMDQEYAKAMKKGFLVHFSLHEALFERDEVLERNRALRDGTVFDKSIPIPDGFFLIADTYRNDPALEKAIIDGVRKVTHIAVANSEGKVYGQPIQQEGVIHACIKGSDVLFTNPQYAFTTEVTPESKKIKEPREIINAHVAAIDAALTHLVA